MKAFTHTLIFLPFLLSAQVSVSSYGIPYIKYFDETCDWRGQSDLCEQSRGLACSYQGRCECWDQRKTYSAKVHRCVGKAGEECSYLDTERLCTENAYCLEDRSLSPIPLCVCLKGYFRSENGSCHQYSKYDQPCDPYRHSTTCEPDSGLRCLGFKCQCEPGSIYDSVRDLCISRAGHKCSKTLNNCVENADCSEKTWALDELTGATKMSGYRCACRGGLKVTEEGLCASEYGGPCNKTSDCVAGESLTCLNSLCQCHPLSQIYDKRLRKCFNLVGTACQDRDREGDVQDDEKKLRKEDASLSSGTEGAHCISNSKCLPSSSSESHYECQCVNGSSPTLIRNCLLNYQEPCMEKEERENDIQIRSTPQILVLESEMKCNVFEGLICHSDAGRCLCADPSLVYDSGRKSCVARAGSPCGHLKLGMLDLKEDVRGLIFIHCEANSTCIQEAGGGRSFCVPEFSKRRGAIAGNGNLSNFILNNARVITETV